MNQERERRLFSWLYVCMYMAFSFGLTQFTPFLSKIGYDEMERGILLSSYALITIFLQMFIGFFADKYQTIKRFIVVLMIIYLLTTCLFYLTESKLFFLHLLLLAISGGLINTCTGLSDTWILKSSPYLRNNFPFIKAFGSIGWAGGSILLSFLIAKAGYTGLSFGIFLLSLFSLVLIFFLTDVGKSTKHSAKVTLADFKEVIFNKDYRLLVFILFLLYSVIIANNITVVDKMLQLGASDLQIGYKWSIQSLLEIPSYLFGAAFLRKYSNFALLMICAVTLTTQFIGFSLTENVWVIILLSGLQFLTTPIIMIASKQLIFHMTTERMQSTSQLFALSIFTGLSSLLIPIVAGSLIKYFNVNLTLLLLATLPIIAFGCIIFLKKRVIIHA
ncbi:MFS transporter [Listeria sp. SHR_NRA_18]|uniref:MFS transporter n=1 Tax=Listeria sp. SHR_NRA_18 TaxID=2269046 RepID=UPI00051CE1F5|nr:MFS transporter [Listeria sp. SHR_NRA_18]KGL41171.1 sugar:proton symporter [Listeriaceae bacterium FSL A5-0209]RQW67481.1 MFS transporter [Listeria sp. SHR_NRA_18]